MSSRAGKMEKEVAKAGLPPQETKTVGIRIDVKIDDAERSVLIEIAGVPKDLPQEFEHTIVQTAERQFAQSVNSYVFMTTFEKGKTGKEDKKPIFYNLSKAKCIEVLDLVKVYEIEDHTYQRLLCLYLTTFMVCLIRKQKRKQTSWLKS